MATVRMTEKEAIRCGLIAPPTPPAQHVPVFTFGTIMLGILMWMVGFTCALLFIR